jgi:hypothetical protein
MALRENCGMFVPLAAFLLSYRHYLILILSYKEGRAGEKEEQGPAIQNFIEIRPAFLDLRDDT